MPSNDTQHFPAKLVSYRKKRLAMQINIPDEPLRRSGYTRDALLLDLAVMLYQKQVFDLLQATRLANCSYEKVADTIRQRGIVLREAQIEQQARRRQLLQRLAHGWDRWRHLQEVDVAAWIREDRSRHVFPYNRSPKDRF